MLLKALHLLLVLSTLTFGFAEAMEGTPVANDSPPTLSIAGEEHQHHEAESHADEADSHCSQCCHLSLNALPRCNAVTSALPFKQNGASSYARRLVSQTPLTPFRPPIA